MVFSHCLIVNIQKIKLFATLAPCYIVEEKDEQSIYYSSSIMEDEQKNYPINQMEKFILIIKLNLN